MAITNVIQLRQMLADRFPGLRTRLEPQPPSAENHWPTGLAQLDEALGGGLPRGELTEMVAKNKSSGSTSVIHALLDQAAAKGQITTVIDGSDTLDVTHLNKDTLRRLLWVQCRSAGDAMKAADLVLRDNNLSLVILDLVSNPAHELRKIPPPAWYRFQRLLEVSGAVCVVLTPWAMVSPAASRITLSAEFSLEMLESNTASILAKVSVIAEERQGRGRSQDTA